MELKYKDYTVTGNGDEIAELIFCMEHIDRALPAQPTMRISTSPAIIETPETPKAAIRKAPRKEVDWGKAKALRDAGWSYDKIGEELRISGVTVSAHLKAMEQEVEADD